MTRLVWSLSPGDKGKGGIGARGILFRRVMWKSGYIKRLSLIDSPFPFEYVANRRKLYFEICLKVSYGWQVPPLSALYQCQTFRRGAAL